MSEMRRSHRLAACAAAAVVLAWSAVPAYASGTAVQENRRAENKHYVGAARTVNEVLDCAKAKFPDTYAKLAELAAKLFPGGLDELRNKYGERPLTALLELKALAEEKGIELNPSDFAPLESCIK
ncbi:hypothetical protein [Streptomyces violascens]|uniref:Secreted protein n=1 Tax=Streptomyces violascens TaxID=67381 RepID=A0ABQ3QS87_9ACTN|nr:hypothetical protein [Streptomyces violascens]GGU48187.1 hypothetical protein GCM10010289_80950 [Streptomyces violascens]GHI40124.1 hypothetical protein Sviol_45320 [Streptomyces violascens]